jgi:hypothetical protein
MYIETKYRKLGTSKYQKCTGLKLITKIPEDVRNVINVFVFKKEVFLKIPSKILEESRGDVFVVCLLSRFIMNVLE